MRTRREPSPVGSAASGIAVYDTLFVELAERERAPLATFDQRLLKTWPAIARRPGEIARPVAALCTSALPYSLRSASAAHWSIAVR